MKKINKIQFKYDKNARALYLKVVNGKVAKTIETSPGFLVDYDKKGCIIGIEMLNASKTSNPHKLTVDLRNLQKIRN